MENWALAEFQPCKRQCVYIQLPTSTDQTFVIDSFTKFKTKVQFYLHVSNQTLDPSHRSSCVPSSNTSSTIVANLVLTFRSESPSIGGSRFCPGISYTFFTFTSSSFTVLPGVTSFFGVLPFALACLLAGDLALAVLFGVTMSCTQGGHGFGLNL